MQPDDDSAETKRLLGAIQAGERGAFDLLFAWHRGYLIDAIRFRIDPQLRGRVDASDIVQEAQLEAYRRLDNWFQRRPMPFRLWLRKTAQERLQKARRRHLRATGRAASREVDLPARSSLVLVKHLAAPGHNPDQHVANQELAERVRYSLAKLNEVDREVIYMRIFEGLAHDEIAAVLDIEPAAVRKRFGRALLRLRSELVRGKGSEDFHD
ncbi:MAG: sigma-70 family RNA polymerase sigma factor [Pirellulales bacterium]